MHLTPPLKIDKINIPNTGISLVPLHLAPKLPLNKSIHTFLWLGMFYEGAYHLPGFLRLF